MGQHWDQFCSSVYTVDLISVIENRYLSPTLFMLTTLICTANVGRQLLTCLLEGLRVR